MENVGRFKFLHFSFFFPHNIYPESRRPRLPYHSASPPSFFNLLYLAAHFIREQKARLRKGRHSPLQGRPASPGGEKMRITWMKNKLVSRSEKCRRLKFRTHRYLLLHSPRNAERNRSLCAGQRLFCPAGSRPGRFAPAKKAPRTKGSASRSRNSRVRRRISGWRSRPGAPPVAPLRGKRFLSPFRARKFSIMRQLVALSFARHGNAVKRV